MLFRSDALGRVVGNGGDWIELLLLEDTDLRGWHLELEDMAGDAGTLTFGNADVLGSLRAGTILTIAADLPEDTSYDPDNGDWRLHLQVNAGTVSGDTFRVTNSNWQLTITDAEGYVRFGPAGEGVGEVDGIGKDEAGVLEETPGEDFRRTTGDWRGEERSTFGSPNVWDGGEQDLDALRGIEGGIVEVDSGSPDTDASPSPALSPDDCGCGGGSATALLLLPWLRRRR